MIRRHLLALGVLAALAVPAGAFEKVRMASGQTIEALPGQVIVRYREGAAPAGRARLAAMGAVTRNSVSSIRLELVSVPQGRTVESFLAELRSNPNVEFAEPNGVMHALVFPDTEPNDANFSSQYALRYNDAGFPANINIDEAWKITLGDPSVVVAVVDSGVAQFHPDLLGQLVTGERITIDWLGDGDCTDTPLNTPELSQVGPDQCGSTSSPPDHNPEDDNSRNNTFHGTHVSGIIAALTNNGSAVAGIAPGCKVMPVKVLNSFGNGTFFSIASGITWAADNGASVINLSLGGPFDSSGALQLATAHALSKNCVVVAASGNDGKQYNVGFPASISGVIAVGSINSTNSLSEFSQTGRALDLVAPGESILSLTSGGGVSPETGTSFAAPMVAAVAALIRSVDPTMPYQEVTKYIDFTANDLGPGGFDTNTGFGRLNAGAAVAAAQARTSFISNPADPNESFPYPNPFHPGNGQLVTISLPVSLGSESIEIDIMNLAGEKVKTLTGTNVWDGQNEDGSTVASGLYLYVAKTSQGDTKGKLTLIK